MISGFFLQKKPPCTELNRAHELENCSKIALRSLSRVPAMWLAVALTRIPARSIAEVQQPGPLATVEALRTE